MKKIKNVIKDYPAITLQDFRNVIEKYIKSYIPQHLREKTDYTNWNKLAYYIKNTNIGDKIAFIDELFINNLIPFTAEIGVKSILLQDYYIQLFTEKEIADGKKVLWKKLDKFELCETLGNEIEYWNIQIEYYNKLLLKLKN